MSSLTETISSPLVDLDESMPQNVVLLHHPTTGKYGCYRYNGIHGLACFTSENAAIRFAEWIDLVGMTCDEVSFDEARQVAKGRPLPVCCLMLLDKLDEPVIHYVR